ncbi:hypothetical protein [Streptomyces sp. NPDC001139]
MVGSSHEALHRIFQKDPTLLTKALQKVLHVPFPEPREIAALNVDLTEIEPVERRVDTLLRAETDEGTYLLVVESQGKVDERKRGSRRYPSSSSSRRAARRPSGRPGPSGSASVTGTR